MNNLIKVKLPVNNKEYNYYIKLVKVKEVNGKQNDLYSITTTEGKVFDVNIRLIPKRIIGQYCLLIAREKEVLAITPLTYMGKAITNFYTFTIKKL